jgi:hypothetical protein
MKGTAALGSLASSFFLKDAAMPLDSVLVSVAVVAMFAVFAGVLWWGDTQA